METVKVLQSGRKWQRGIEAAARLVELDGKIRGCLARIEKERGHLEGFQREVEQLHREQREVTVEMGGADWVILSMELQGAERVIRKAKDTMATVKRRDTVQGRLRGIGGWSDCGSDEEGV